MIFLISWINREYDEEESDKNLLFFFDNHIVFSNIIWLLNIKIWKKRK